ncbi:YbfB/YjiJ family MFS transporter [Hoeflea sp. CAU 1731]
MNAASSDPAQPSHFSPQSPLMLALGGMMAMAVAMGVGRFVYTPLLPDLMEGLGLSFSQAGAIASANYVGYLVGAILAGYGWASTRERMVFILALASTTLLLALMPQFTSLAALSIVRFLAGVASAFAMVFGSTILFSHLEVARRNELQALHFGGVGIGLAMSAILLIILSGVEHEWRAGWYVSAVIAGLGSVIAVSLLHTAPATSASAPAREPPLRWNPAFTMITVAYGMFGIGYVVTATFLVAIVRGGPEHAWLEGPVWLVTGLAAMPSVFLWAPFRRNMGLVTTFVAGCLVEAVGVAASVVVPPPYGPLIGGALLGATFVAITAYGLQIGRIFAPEAPRRAFAVMTAAFGLGQIIGPLIAGYLADITGSFVHGSLAAAFALVVSAVFAMLTRAYRTGT